MTNPLRDLKRSAPTYFSRERQRDASGILIDPGGRAFPARPCLWDI